MGYRNTDDYIRLLNQGDSWVIDNTGKPLLSGLAGPFPLAFDDSMDAARASEGLRILHQYSDFDPERNWVDFLRPRVYVSLASNFPWGPDGAIYFSTTETQSSDKSLWFREGASSNPEVGSPTFRLKASATYRVTYTWKSDGAGAFAGPTIAVNGLTGDKTTSVSGGSNAPAPNGSSGAWVTDSFTFTTGSTVRWGFFQITANVSGQDVYIDSLTIEPLRAQFEGQITSNYAWTSSHYFDWNSVTVWGCSWESANRGFRIAETGIYSLSGAWRTASVAGEFYECAIAVNATDLYYTDRTAHDNGAAACQATVARAPLVRGDLVKFQAITSAAGAKTMQGADPRLFTRFQGIRIS